MMATNSTGRAGPLMPKKHHQDTELTNLERTENILMRSESKSEKKVAVVYYLMRNGQLEHPHFIEVPLASPRGLQLTDVINTLNRLRGQGMASMYSWSSKRSYRNGFVWQDLSENDFINPCHGHEYILKGSLLLQSSQSFRSYETVSLSTSKFSSETNSSSEDSNSPILGRKNHSWTTFDDLDEHKVYKAKTTKEFAGKGANVSTQTDDNRSVEVYAKGVEHQGFSSKEPAIKEVSPHFSKSCSSVSRSMKRSIEDYRSPDMRHQTVANGCLNGRMKASVPLMKLIGCGSKKFK